MVIGGRERTMRVRLVTRRSAAFGLLAVLAAAVWGAPAVGAGAGISRMPDGRPDLSGTYDTATLTPLQRPERFGDKLFLTDEEAAAIAEQERALFARFAGNRANRGDASGEYPWVVTEERLYEYACHEGNYALGNILRGARLLEAEALAAKTGGATSSTQP
jgi:hypothetical protein